MLFILFVGFVAYLFCAGFDYGVAEMQHTLDKKPDKFNKTKYALRALLWPIRIVKIIKLLK